ncbi:succinylglutamate desuccinylase/aspartoacylase family protein [Sphingomicrobium sediminis]|uniref:Succinylglutamate desuccinylase/aspartoacylase family protein n=1 Tax=Sphingomicrobium sediminis TaxID=2950949 RepID=A0A9X2ELF5_9SPHN|nr:succinylglutamate desuccinylase/aspartoacylase family protein [Sphingomicrobium sediminis]MCM8557629.1 succinylglutamate desuccinylase/aspartoacylase family protein [Sphingomicrobium sediminis]
MGASIFEFDEQKVKPGHRASFDLPISRDATGSLVHMPVRIVHGAEEGPVLLISAAVHGDEISGIEVVRRILAKVKARKLRGTLICVPIVNPYGFVAWSRYLPDRRDLNRSFPGREDGSLASRIAYMFRTRLMRRADFAIDLHSAAIHRYNLPQVRVSPDCTRASELARAFSPPIIMHSKLREGSMRGVAMDEGLEMILYEAGEALRFDDFSTRVGVNGIMRVMQEMDMIDLKPTKRKIIEPLESTRSLWLRSPRGGIAAIRTPSGRKVHLGQQVAVVRDPTSTEESIIKSPIEGIVIGHSRMGVVNRGDALLHIAQLGEPGIYLDPLTEERLSGAMLDEHEID